MLGCKAKTSVFFKRPTARFEEAIAKGLWGF